MKYLKRLSEHKTPVCVKLSDGETVEGTINMLCSDRYTDLGEGATYQSTFLDIAAW